MSNRLESEMTERSPFIRDLNKQCREIIRRTLPSQSCSVSDTKWVLRNVEVTPKLQGKLPRCGLSALSMAVEMLGIQKNRFANTVNYVGEKDKTCELDNLLSFAQSGGITCQGEMYSADNMTQLAGQFYGCNAVVVNDGFADNNIISEFFKGSAVLVPYDADKNHEPCMDNGHRAHWSLLTGILCKLDNVNFDWTKCRQDVEEPILFHAIPSSELEYCHLNLQDIYVCAKQGKSKHTAVWSLDSLKKSNGNLFELDPYKGEQTTQYLLPEGGVKAGLCGKIVVLSNKD